MIKLSVREVVEFVKRSGSIDSGYRAASRMVDGIRAHQKIQRERKKQAAELGYEYIAEKRLCHAFILDGAGGVELFIEGRADGVFTKDGVLHVEEIKSTAANLELLQDNDTHWAQAKFYAYFLAVSENVDSVTAVLTYCSVDKPNLTTAKVFVRLFHADELTAFVDEVLAEYQKWAKERADHAEARNVSIKAGNFPYGEYRSGQREFAVAVYRAVQKKCGLFIEAPTGIGKTMSALFPAVKSMGEGLCEKIFYLTAKTITGQAAQAAVEVLASNYYTLRFVALTGKDKICPLPGRACNPEDCRYANGHFDRVNDALWDALTHDALFNRQTILHYAEKHTVCPHEFSFDLSMFCDIVIGDYNYAFDPKSSLKRYFSNGGDFVFLIDEAHNLIDRAREMFSAELSSKAFAELRRKFKARTSVLYKTLTAIIAEIRSMVPETASLPVPGEPPPDSLQVNLYRFVEIADRLLAEGIPDKDTGEKFLEVYFAALDYLKVDGEFDERYCVLTEQSGKDVTVKLLCLDPSKMLRGCLDKITSATFFSATLAPLEYFRNVLGGTEDDILARLPSPFDPKNFLVLTDPRISTKYADRDYGLEPIADALNAMVSAKLGNYFAFFPSFEYAGKVFDVYAKKYEVVDTDIIIQSRYMSEDEREDFLSLFQPRKRGLLAFAVMGGVFSEGIDLIGDKLTGAAVISVGLPLVCPERDVLRHYYNSSGYGFEYAYMFPGLSKILQAVGRVIRSHNDKGVALLIDSRFAQERYTALFPPLWQNGRTIRRNDDYHRYLSEFWQQ